MGFTDREKLFPGEGETLKNTSGNRDDREDSPRLDPDDQSLNLKKGKQRGSRGIRRKLYHYFLRRTKKLRKISKPTKVEKNRPEQGKTRKNS